MPRVLEEDEASTCPVKEETSSAPPCLPPTPLFLTTEQTKRRHIISSLVISENNYLTSLRRLVNDYKQTLEESNPPILSQAKVDVLFHKVEDILTCHSQFRMALSEAVLKWDDVQMTDLNVWLHLYGTEANPTNIMVTNLQWGKWGDDDKVVCGPS